MSKMGESKRRGMFFRGARVYVCVLVCVGVCECKCEVEARASVRVYANDVIPAE